MDTAVIASALKLAADMPINLQVGERRFTTTRDTLVGESGFFASLLSGRWDNKLPDGSYFIDADGDLFQHVLAFLRRGVFPLFFDMTRGHDLSRYLAVLEEARYFQIPLLEDWLASKKYLEAVKMKHTMKRYVCRALGLEEWDLSTLALDTAVDFRPTYVTRKTYICPREIPGHKGNPGACGRKCANARGGGEYGYEEVRDLHMFVVHKTVVTDPEVCVSR